MTTRRRSSVGARRRNVRTSRRSAGISRGGFLRTAGMAAAGVGAAAVGLSGVAKATGWVPEVTVDASEGLGKLQDEVDIGGNILLTGIWDFQDSGIVIGRDSENVTIKGDGALATKILHGTDCFTIINNVDCTIENLWFDMPGKFSIRAHGAGELTIRNTRHTNNKSTADRSMFIEVDIKHLENEEFEQTGNVLIENNEFSGASTQGFFPANIGVHPYPSATVPFHNPNVSFIIRNNKIDGGTVGIDVGWVTSGNVFIDKNRISDVAYGIINTYGDGFNVTRNTITINNLYGWSPAMLIGGWAEGYGIINSVYKSNTIISTGGPDNRAWIGIEFNTGENTTFQGNRIVGDYFVCPFIMWNVVKNSVFIGNNPYETTSFYFPIVVFNNATEGNVWVGDGEVVADWGTDNMITGSETWSGPLTPDQENLIAEAAQQMGGWNPGNQ